MMKLGLPVPRTWMVPPNLLRLGLAKAAVRAKVESLFPDHEHEEFTEHFWGLIQFWRKTEADRMNVGQ